MFFRFFTESPEVFSNADRRHPENELPPAGSGVSESQTNDENTKQYVTCRDPTASVDHRKRNPSGGGSTRAKTGSEASGDRGNA